MSMDLNLPEGTRVKITSAFAPALIGERGTIIGNDGYTYVIRLDRIKPELMGYEDAKTGVINSEPQNITTIGDNHGRHR